jgi:hypothetical protein
MATATEKRQALSHYDAYKRSTARQLRDVYGTYSQAKDKAWDDCINLLLDYGGYDLKVITANGWMFTAGFMFEDDGKTMFMYITKGKHIAVEVE